MKYRKQIDGLRAIAVIPVILYHAGIQRFSGGYVGVDVFFVISGYLITSIILKDLQEENFSITNFYERRARRILPALFATLIATVVVAWLIFLPNEMKVLGQGILASAAFVANILLYAKGDDYFGLQSEQNPILHIWSLAVEEQFYFIFPLLMFVIWKFAGKRLAAWFLAISIISLGLSEWLLANDRSAAFYMLPARAWELLIGSILAVWLADSERQRGGGLSEVLGFLGLMLILTSVFFFDESTAFPGVAALIPVIGTALVIYFATENTLVGRALSWKVLTGIGLISYSLYLWHQPVFAFYHSYFGSAPALPELLALIFAVFLLATFTWRFVERPFRNKEGVGRRTVFTVSAIGIVLFVAFGIGAHQTSGYPFRDALFARLASNVGYSLACNGNTEINETCSDSPTPRIAVFGNSFAMHLIDGVRAVHPQGGVVQLTQDSCPPHLLDDRVRLGKSNCSAFVGNALETIRNTESIETVVISSPFGDMLEQRSVEAFEKTIADIKAYGKGVVIIGPTPSTGKDFAKCFVRNRHQSDFSSCDFTRSDIPEYQFKVIDSLNEIASRHSVRFINLFELICRGEICAVSRNGVLLYRDWGHLSIEGSREIFRQLKAGGSLGVLAET